MADWQFPKDDMTDAYADFLTYIKNRDVDVAKMQAPSANIPTGYIRLNSNKLQSYNGATWDDIVIAQAGGGTGATSLGTMAAQNANSVAITGGSITALSALTFTCNITPTADDSYNLGAAATQMKYGWFKSGFKIPVGTDKWIPA